MAYGRLDIFWPDGTFETRPLYEPNTSVGRSTGNVITLETNNISRYHFNIAYDGERVFITDLDSSNGTHVDGVKLVSETPQPLYGGEEIQVGDLRMIYFFLDESPTRPMVVPEDTTQRIELEAPNFRIDLQAYGPTVTPGAHTSAELTIHNTSSSKERYYIQVTGMPPKWIRIDRREVNIQPGRTAEVVISFKPLRRPDSTPGDYPIHVTVRRGAPDSDVFLTANLSMTVRPFAGFGMAVSNKRLQKGDTLLLHLHNQGSAPLPLLVSGHARDNSLKFDLPNNNLTLQPGQRVQFQGGVLPTNPRLIGEKRQYPFDIIVRSRDEAAFTASTRASYTEIPALPTWAPVAAVGVVSFLSLIVIIALVLIVTTPREPEITSFTVNSTLVARGEPLTVNWSAENAGALNITINGTPVFNETGDELTTYTIDTSNLNGEVVVGLSVRNRDLLDSSSQTVSVYQPISIDLFTTEPQTLIRYVVQPLTVRWVAPGAILTRLNGLADAALATPEAITMGEDVTIDDLVVVPGDDLTLSLYTEDAGGNTLEETLIVELVDPICSANSAAVLIYEGPDLAHEQVDEDPIAEGEAVVVDAQDPSGDWLRVLLNEDAHGWVRRDQLDCDPSFTTENLRRAVDIPPPPAATAEATVELIVTATPAASPVPAEITPDQ